MESYCLFCKSGQEGMIIELLKRSGYSAFSPLSVRNKPDAGGLRRTKARLLPGYVFFDADEAPDWENIRRYSGVLKILRYEDGNCALRGEDLAFVDWLRRYEGMVDVSQVIKVGTKIAFVGGPLVGMEAKVLKVNKSRKSVADFEEAYRLVREAGFRNVSVDLIHSLPGQTPADWERALRETAEFGPEHISAYSLIIEEGTPFYEKYGDIAGEARVGTVAEDSARAELPALPSEEDDRLMDHMTGEILAEYGYEQYEISNYAKSGFPCMHNLGYWSDVPYLGFGLGASSYLNGTRFSNTRDLEAYLAAARSAAEKSAAFVPERCEVQVLTEEEREEEFFFLGLRRTDGVEAAEFAERFGKPWDRYLPGMERMEQAGFLERTAEGFRLTRAGQDVSNAVFAEILL